MKISVLPTMSDGSNGFPISEMLRDVLGYIKDETKRLVFLPIIRGYIRLNIRSNINSDGPIIGVFGPYEDGGDVHLHAVCQKIATRGCIAIAGEGYYHPSAPNTLEPLTRTFPDPVEFFLTLDDSPFFLYRYLMPSIIDGATVKLYPPRSQIYELAGCVEREVPILGYLHDDRITPIPTNKCSHLQENVNGSMVNLRCTATSYGNCPGNAPNPPGCPFLDVYDVPWIQKRWFIESPRRIMFAFNELDALDRYLDEVIGII